MIKQQIVEELARRELLKREEARQYLMGFTQYTMLSYRATWYHEVYAKILDQWIQGNMRRLLITMPPQHGKSELSTRRLPAMMMGRNRKLRGGVSSYNATKAREFSRDVQRIIADPLYYNIFPDTLIANNRETLQHLEVLESESKWLLDAKKRDLIRTQEYFETFNHFGKKGSTLRAVGRGGALTGNPLDFMVMDDLYKDQKEANSAVIRLNVIDWYVSVVRTRFHNLSQELMVFTRWHPEDLIGHIEKEEGAELLTTLEQINNPDPGKLYKINFPALQTADTISELDTRTIGQALWEERHSRAKLLKDKALDEEKFESLQQGDPRPMVGLLAQKEFKTYKVGQTPSFRYVYNYTDTADTGTDYLCSICYGVGIDDNIYVLDLVYTQEPQEVTEQEVANLLRRCNISSAMIESNNGGRAFARNVDRLNGGRYHIQWFHQSENKESRILTNSASVKQKVFFPEGWGGRWPDFKKHIMGFKRNFKANTHDDAWDALTGCWEFSGLDLDSMSLWN